MNNKILALFAGAMTLSITASALTINPTPKSLNVDSSLTYSLPKAGKEGKVKDVKDLFYREIAALPVKPDITIDFGGKAAKKAGVENKSGAYILTIDKKGITITGYDELGAYYGMLTLRQILTSEEAAAGAIPYLTISDSPDLGMRGVVEGFYGNPWSHNVRLSLIDFMGKNKMNTYVYGPKDDPYHSSPDWRKPYPAYEASQIKQLVNAARKAHVNFVWAIHPGKDIQWNEEDYQNLVKKFDLMYALGVRNFAIFFDDIEGEGTDPMKQVELLNRLEKEYVKKRDGVNHLIVCPTDYSRSWAGTSENSALPTYGRELDKNIRVFYTGDFVCSDFTVDTMNFLDNLIKRPGLYWWNFPVTDYARHIVMQGPAYGLDNNMTDALAAGIVSNPMEHGEASKLALYGVADYAWNTKDYNPKENWERALAEVAGDAKEAYRTFAIHNCDTEKGYRRDESWETETFTLDEYTPEKASALRAEFEKIQTVPQEMEEKCKDIQLLNELDPWMKEFAKLGKRGVQAVDLMEAYRSGNDEKYWNIYNTSIFTPEQRAEWEKHKSGTLKLQPFIDKTYEDTYAGFAAKFQGKNPMTPDILRRMLEPRYPEGIFNAFDSDLNTVAPLPVGSVTGIAVNPGTMTIYSNASAQNPLTVMLVQVGEMKKGMVAPDFNVDIKTIETPYTKIEIPAGVSSVGFKTYKGEVDINEVIFENMKWPANNGQIDDTTSSKSKSKSKSKKK